MEAFESGSEQYGTGEVQSGMGLQQSPTIEVFCRQLLSNILKSRISVNYYDIVSLGTAGIWKYIVQSLFAAGGLFFRLFHFRERQLEHGGTMGWTTWPFPLPKKIVELAGPAPMTQHDHLW
jgi:hypothetical protein